MLRKGTVSNPTRIRAPLPAAATLSLSAPTHIMGRSISHVLFDMDGLLLDTETLYTVAQQQVCRKYGRDFTWALKAKMMGKKALEASQLLVDELGLVGQLSPEDFLKQVRAAGKVHAVLCATCMHGVGGPMRITARGHAVSGHGPCMPGCILTKWHAAEERSMASLRLAVRGVAASSPPAPLDALIPLSKGLACAWAPHGSACCGMHACMHACSTSRSMSEARAPH